MGLHVWCWVRCRIPRAGEGREGAVGRFLGEIACESVEAVGPEPLVVSEPALRVLQRRGVEPARYRAAAFVPSDQAGDFKHVEMLEHRRQGHGKRRCQSGDREFRGLAETDQHGAPCRIGQGGKDAVQVMGLIVNHKVHLRGKTRVVNTSCRPSMSFRGAVAKRRRARNPYSLTCGYGFRALGLRPSPGMTGLPVRRSIEQSRRTLLCPCRGTARQGTACASRDRHPFPSADPQRMIPQNKP